MSDFLGKRVKITTPDFVVEGTVEAIEQGRLVLKDVTSKSTGEHLDKMIVEGGHILDVVVLESKKKKKRSARSTPEPGSARGDAPVEALPARPAPAQAEAPVAVAATAPATRGSAEAQTVPQCTALQLNQILKAMLDKGYSPFTIAERAGEGLEAVVKTRATAGHIVFIVGSHCVGEWAIAAARRLVSSFGVVVVSPIKDAAKALESQTKPFVAAGGKFVATQSALFAALDGAAPALVVDALAGFESTLQDQLDEEEYAAAQWLLEWSKCCATRISVCTASCEPSAVVSCGFPTTASSHYLVDIGIPDSVLVSLKLARFRGLKFNATFIPI